MSPVVLGTVLACSALLLYNVGLALHALDAREPPIEEGVRPALLREDPVHRREAVAGFGRW